MILQVCSFISSAGLRNKAFSLRGMTEIVHFTTFPQIKGLGRSPMSEFHWIVSKDEAKAYLDDEILEARLKEICEELLKHSDKSAEDILGRIDAMKLKSSMTLFDNVSPDDVFDKVLEVFFMDRRDRRTLEMIKKWPLPQKAHNRHLAIVRFWSMCASSSGKAMEITKLAVL